MGYATEPQDLLTDAALEQAARDMAFDFQGKRPFTDEEVKAVAQAYLALKRGSAMHTIRIPRDGEVRRVTVEYYSGGMGYHVSYEPPVGERAWGGYEILLRHR
jgi:hypothetical protein